MYDELVKRLRGAADWRSEGRCDGCPYEDYPCYVDCSEKMHRQAANAIEELMRFAHFVAKEVMVSDEEWELNNMAFPEIICRKLNNLGVVSKDGELWHYEPPKRE